MPSRGVEAIRGDLTALVDRLASEIEERQKALQQARTALDGLGGPRSPKQKKASGVGGVVSLRAETLDRVLIAVAATARDMQMIDNLPGSFTVPEVTDRILETPEMREGLSRTTIVAGIRRLRETGKVRQAGVVANRRGKASAAYVIEEAGDGDG